MPRVRLIDVEGEQVGLKTRDEALEYAWGKNLDLVEVAPDANPPVCRVMDYSKYKYEQEQKQKLARKHQSTITIKEIKLRPKIDPHDYETKKGHVLRFLKNRDKVKVTIMFRGREMYHPERGRSLLLRLADDVKDLAVIEADPLQDGRNMVMMLAPHKEAVAAKPANEAGETRHHTEPSPRPSLSRPRSPSKSPRRPPRPPSRRSKLPSLQPDTEHAQTKDPLRREEALQDHRHRQAHAPARDEVAHPREEVAQAEAGVPPRPVRFRRRHADGRAPARSALTAMTRVKRSVNAQKKRRNVLDEASGYWGLKSKTYKRAKEQVQRSLQYAYRDRRVRKREFRKLWIVRINAAARQHDMSYSQLIAGLHRAEITLDRKVLADLAVHEPAAFAAIATQAKAALAAAD